MTLLFTATIAEPHLLLKSIPEVGQLWRNVPSAEQPQRAQRGVKKYKAFQRFITELIIIIYLPFSRHITRKKRSKEH